MNTINKNKLGIVKISTYRNRDEREIQLKKDIFSFITPICLITDNSFHNVEYESWLCYCDKFKKVDEECVYPEYIITLHANKDHEVIKFDIKEA